MPEGENSLAILRVELARPEETALSLWRARSASWKTFPRLIPIWIKHPLSPQSGLDRGKLVHQAGDELETLN